MKQHVFVVVLCLLVAALVGLPGCGDVGGRSCTLVGCTSLATGTFDVPLVLTDLDGRRLEICRRSQCVYATMNVTSGELQCTQATDPYWKGGRVTCESETEALPTATRIHPVYQQGVQERLTDGDVFTFRITDASGEHTFAQGGGTVPKYDVSYPNGKACDEDDPCSKARF